MYSSIRTWSWGILFIAMNHLPHDQCIGGTSPKCEAECRARKGVGLWTIFWPLSWEMSTCQCLLSCSWGIQYSFRLDENFFPAPQVDDQGLYTIFSFTIFGFLQFLAFSIYFAFLSDPGKPGVRSLGPDVRHSMMFLKLNWCYSGWWRYQVNTYLYCQ